MLDVEGRLVGGKGVLGVKVEVEAGGRRVC